MLNELHQLAGVITLNQPIHRQYIIDTHSLHSHLIINIYRQHTTAGALGATWCTQLLDTLHSECTQLKHLNL